MPAQAAPPTRSTASVTLSLDLLTIPVSVYTMTDDKAGRVSRQEWTDDNGQPGAKVGRKPINTETGEIVEHSDVIKCVDVNGEMVPLTDEEIESVTTTVKGVAEIIGFYPMGTFYDVHPEKHYSVRPAQRKIGSKKAPDPAAERAFFLLTESMFKEQVYAILTITLRSQTRYAALTCDGDLYILHFDEQVRQDLPEVDGSVTDRELELGQQLISSKKQATVPALTDENTAAVMKFAEAKATGTITATTRPTAPSESPDDLLAALEATLAAGKASEKEKSNV